MPAAKLFMKLTGRKSKLIKGDCQVSQFKEQIELDDWKWAIKTATGANRSEKTVEPGIFSFSKLMDRASTAMLSAMRDGEFMDAEIVMEETNEEQFELTILLEGVLITRYDLSTDVGGPSGEVSEDWDFDYESITFQYRSSPKDGVASVMMKRPVGASNTSMDATAEAKIMDAARDMEPRKLDDLFRRIKEEHASRGTDGKDGPGKPGKPGKV